jgi:hypothetical protein
MQWLTSPVWWTSAAAVLLGMLIGGLGSRVAAQSAEDSVAVIWTAWRLAKGDRPFGHPAGTAATVCLRVSNADGVDSVESDVSCAALNLLKMLGDSIESRGDVRLSADCRAEARPTFGTWMLANNEPAVLVTIRQLAIISPSQARVTLEIIAGGRYARGMVCKLERALVGAAWTGGCTEEWVA